MLLRGAAVITVWRALARAIDQAERRDSVVAPPRLVELLAVLETEAEAAMSALGHPDVRGEPDSASSLRDDTRQMSSGEAAATLNMSQRQVRRLAADLGGVLVGNRWVLDSVSVVSLANDRQAG